MTNLCALFSELINLTLVRVTAFMTLSLALSFRASAEDYSDAIHAYLQQSKGPRHVPLLALRAPIEF
jgi:hypothetical protein